MLSDGGSCIRIEPGAASSDAIIWCDTLASPDDDVIPLLSDLGLPQYILDSCAMPRRFPETEAFSGGVLMHLPVRQIWNTRHSSYLTLLLLPNKLISLHRNELPFLTRAADRLVSGDGPHLADAKDLLLYLLEGVVETNIQSFVAARATVEDVSASLDDTPDEVGADDIRPVRRSVARLAIQHEEQYYCLATLQSILSNMGQQGQRNLWLRDLLDTQGHLARSVDRMETRLRDMLQYCHYILQEHTEQRLRTLTILSSICLPLTLIAGIYGMNFKAMPELEWDYGYYLVLASMFAIACGLIGFFWKRGWLR